MSEQLSMSCMLCLRADEVASMVPVDVVRVPGDEPLYMRICVPCAREIASALKAIDCEDNQEVLRDDRPSPESLVHESSVESSCDALGPGPAGNRPGVEDPRIDRREPKIPAGGSTGADSKGEG